MKALIVFLLFLTQNFCLFSANNMVSGIITPYQDVGEERLWLTKTYLPSLEGRILFVGIAVYNADYYKMVKDPSLFESIDFDPRVKPYGSPYAHYTEDFLTFDPGYLYDHICLFGVLGKHYDARSGELYNVDTQEKITKALEHATKLLKPNGTLLLGPDTVSGKPSNLRLPHINRQFWLDRFSQSPLDKYKLILFGDGKANLIWWGEKITE
jgi:hypothetical protein